MKSVYARGLLECFTPACLLHPYTLISPLPPCQLEPDIDPCRGSASTPVSLIPALGSDWDISVLPVPLLTDWVWESVFSLSHLLHREWGRKTEAQSNTPLISCWHTPLFLSISRFLPPKKWRLYERGVLLEEKGYLWQSFFTSDFLRTQMCM